MNEELNKILKKRLVDQIKSDKQNYLDDESFELPPSSIPMLYEDYLLSLMMIFNDRNPFDNITEFYLYKYSRLFEFEYDGKYFYLQLKKQYKDIDNYDELAKLGLENLKKIKEKDITFNPDAIDLPKNYLIMKLPNNYFFSEGKFVSYLKNYENEPSILSVLKKLISNKLQLDCNLYEKTKQFQLLLLYFRYNNHLDDYNDAEILLAYLYIDIIINSEKNLFVKFADKSYLKQEDFILFSNKLKENLENRIGKEKLNEIIEKTKDITSVSKLYNIIDGCLIKKRNINDEIALVEKQQNEVPENSPEFRALKQRLNKLLLYKNNFDSEEVIIGEESFQNYYGFEFDGVYVFDYFLDDEDENVLNKSKREYGNGIFISTIEDYLKVKNFKPRLEFRKYIHDNLFPCADTMNHGGDEKTRLFKKLEGVKAGIKKRNYVVNLSTTDNPVTDEEIAITQAEFELFVSKFVSSDEKVIEELKKKSQKFRTKESIDREKNIQIVQEWKQKQEVVSDDEYNEKDKEEINREVDRSYVILEKINLERANKNLEPLSFEDSDYYEVYKAIIDYEEEHHVKSKARRDPIVALKTKNRTFYNNAYHCELCGEPEMDPAYLDSHHFIPISKGGPDDIYNTVCLCVRCHRGIHTGHVTDYQNYKLIKTIKDFIMSEVPEALPYFEKTLGFKENKYLERLESVSGELEQIESQIDRTFDMELPEEEILSKAESLEQQKISLRKEKDELFALANRIQDYYNYQKNEEITENTINR